MSELRGLAAASLRGAHFDCLITFFSFGLNAVCHRCVEEPRRYGNHSYPELAKITRHWQNHPVDSTLSCTVRYLGGSPFLTLGARNHQNQSFLHTSIVLHLNSRVFSRMHSSEQIDLSVFSKSRHVKT
jgi:hypothetical protein